MMKSNRIQSHTQSRESQTTIRKATDINVGVEGHRRKQTDHRVLDTSTKLINQPEHIIQASLFSIEHMSFASSNSRSLCLASAAANSGSSAAALAAFASLSVPSNETLGAAAAVAVPVAAVVSGIPFAFGASSGAAAASSSATAVLMGSADGAGVRGVELPLPERFFSIHDTGGPLLFAFFIPFRPLARL